MSAVSIAINILKKYIKILKPNREMYESNYNFIYLFRDKMAQA